MAEVKTERAKQWATFKKRINNNRESFWDYVHAMVLAVETKAYLEEFKTVDEFADSEGFSRSRFYELKQSCEVRRRLSDMSDTLPTTARQVKEIAKVPEESQSKVWAIATEQAEKENRTPTPKEIKQAAREFIEPRPRPTINKTLPPPEEFTADPPPADGDAWKKLRSIVKQHATAGQRAVDDLQDQHPNTNIWKRVLKKFQEIASEMEGWK